MPGRQLARAQQRAVLAVLLLDAGRVASTDRLVDELWRERPPRAVSTLHGYVMRLRRMIATGSPCRLVTRGRGYELLVADGELDAIVFDRLVAELHGAILTDERWLAVPARVIRPSVPPATP
jgi:DNA-binding SARP family transcriptional activator